MCACSIATWKEIVWKQHNFFCLCYVPALTSAQSFHKRTKSSRKFDISLNVKFWKKYNLRSSRLCFKISQGVPEWNSNDWTKLLYFFGVQVLRRKSGVYIFKVHQGDDEWNYNWNKKTLRETILKTIFICEIHYSKYQHI